MIRSRRQSKAAVLQRRGQRHLPLLAVLDGLLKPANGLFEQCQLLADDCRRSATV
jgi:hypothetical protein